MGFIGTSSTRVEEHTAPEVNDRILERITSDVEYFAAHPEQIDRRLEELDREWDTERWLQLNSAALSLLGLGLGLAGSRKWLLLPTGVQLFFLQHGVQGWCPPLPVFRRMGVRTIREIEIERAALRALRGDFADAGTRPDAALRAVSSGMERAPAHPKESAADALMPTRTRVRENTPRAINERIDREMERRVRACSTTPDAARRRLEELEREWDIERILEVEGPATTLTGIAMSAAGRRRGWLAVSLFAQAMMVLHALQGFYPLLPLLRRLGVRTREEIAAERYAIKAILGDFSNVERAEHDERPSRTGEAAMQAAMAPA